MSKRRRRAILIATLLTLSLVVTWLGSSYAVAYKLTRRAKPVYDVPAADLTWGTIQSHRLAAGDGETLGAWYIDGEPQRPLVILCHGNGGCRSACLREAELASSTGCSVLLITLRCHGDSTGRINDFGLSARHDVIAGVTWAEEHQPGKPIVVWGQSVGSAAAIFAAEELGPRVKGYILECPFRDLLTVTRNRTRIYLPPILDQIGYAGLRITAPFVLPDFQRISPLEAVRGISSETPVLLLSGSADLRARPEEARAIHERIADHCRWVEIECGDHLELSVAEPMRYKETIADFLNSIPR